MPTVKATHLQYPCNILSQSMWMYQETHADTEQLALNFMTDLNRV